MSTTMTVRRAALLVVCGSVPLLAQVRQVNAPRPEPSAARARAGAQPGYVFASRSQRTSDGVIARDLTWLDSLEAAARQRSNSPGALRSAAYIALAREAYLRNDSGRLVASLLVDAGVLDGAERTVPAADRELWVLADAQQRAAGRDTAWMARSVALEVALVRASQPLLGAPDCTAWKAQAVRIAEELRRMTRPAAPVVAVAAAPAPAPAPVATPVEPPAPAAAPHELRGVPSRVHFGLDRSDLSPASRRALDALADSLREFPGVRIVLYGHTDMRASAAYNAALSQRRAVSVQRYLEGRGIEPARMEYVAKGKSQLEQGGTSATEHARNRRVEMQFIAPDGREIPSVQQMDDLQLERPAASRAVRRRPAPARPR